MSPRLAAYSIAAGWFGLDRATKLLIQNNMTLDDVATVIPGFFNIVYNENRGAVFGLMSQGESEFRSFFLIGLTTLVIAMVAAILWQTSPGGLAASRWSRLGLSLVLGGGLGNLYDRLASGAVVDFLDVYVGTYHWPSFNVADTGLSVGVGLILLDVLLSRQEAAKS